MRARVTTLRAGGDVAHPRWTTAPSWILECAPTRMELRSARSTFADVHVADEHGAAAQQRIVRDSRHLVEVSLEEDAVVVLS